MGRLFYSAEQLLRRPTMPGMHDPTHLHFHFRPARPANLLVTRDPVSGELNLTAQTFGPLTDRPLTVCLHSERSASPHATQNLTVGAECVVALPGADLVRETWISALPLPRGIFEGDAAGLTLLPSHVVSVPGIVECPVNLECRVELVRRQYSHNAVFLRVVGASVDEEVLTMDRLATIRRYPTYEVDDQTNRFGGAIERLGVNGVLLDCPAFPVGARRGPSADASEWMRDVRDAGYLSQAQHERVDGWLTQWEQLVRDGAGDETLRCRLTRVFELAAWEQWEQLHALVGQGDSA